MSETGSVSQFDKTLSEPPRINFSITVYVSIRIINRIHSCHITARDLRRLASQAETIDSSTANRSSAQGGMGRGICDGKELIHGHPWVKNTCKAKIQSLVKPQQAIRDVRI